jgi:hypothetical protein
MPLTITKTVYTFSELLSLHIEGKVAKNAVERTRNWLIEGQTMLDWWDYVFELWTKALDQIGFEDAEISFSGFWNQGDGASFTASVDVLKLATFMATNHEATDTIPASNDPGGEDFRGWIVKQIGGLKSNHRYRKLVVVVNFIDARVNRISHRYSHENTCAVQTELHDTGTVSGGPDFRWTSNQPRLRALFEEWVRHAETLRKELCHAIYRNLEEEYEYLTSDECLAEWSEANEYRFDEWGRPEPG